MNNRFYIFFILIVLHSCTTRIPEGAIAVIDGGPVTLQEIKDFYTSDYYNQLNPSEIKEKIKEYVDMKVVEKEVLASGIDRDEYLLQRFELWRINRLSADLQQKAIMEKILSEKKLRELYEELSVVSDISEILIRYKKSRDDEPKRSRSEAWTLIGKLRSTITPGNFSKLARQYSDDTTTAQKGGRKGEVRAALLDSAYYSILRNLKAGRIGGPFETGKGFYLVLLHSQKRVYLNTFEEEIVNLRKMAAQLWKNEISVFTGKYLQDLAAGYNFQFNLPGMKEFLSEYRVIDSSLDHQGETKRGSLERPLEILQQITKPVNLGSCDRVVFDKAWLERYMKRYQLPIDSLNLIQNYVYQFAIRELIARKATDLKLDQDPVFEHDFESYKLKSMYNFYFSRHVNREIDPTEQDLLNYYEVKKKEKYLAAELVRIQEILVSDSSLAVRIAEQLHSGADFGKLARQYTERYEARNTGGLLPPFEKDRYGTIGKQAFQRKAGEMQGPFKVGRRYAIIKILERIPSEPKFYNEVKDQVRNDYISEKKEDLKIRELDTLWKKYHVQCRCD